MRLLTFLMLTLLILLMMPALAFAAGPDPTGDFGVGAQLSSALVEILKPTVLLIATWVGARVAGWVKRKAKIDTQTLIDLVLDRSIDYAEARARDWLKAQGNKMPGSDKMKIAVAFATRELARRGLMKTVGKEIEEWIEAMLFRKRPLAFADGSGLRGVA